MTVSRLSGIRGIGVDRMGSLADRASDPDILRLENLDTDVAPPNGILTITQNSTEQDHSNSYLPFLGSNELRQAATDLVNRLAGTDYNWERSTIICAGWTEWNSQYIAGSFGSDR